VLSGRLTSWHTMRAQEYDANMMQEVYNQITAKCFQKCIGKPGDKLDKEEQKCLAKCVDRYIDSREVGLFITPACATHASTLRLFQPTSVLCSYAV